MSLANNLAHQPFDDAEAILWHRNSEPGPPPQWNQVLAMLSSRA